MVKPTINPDGGLKKENQKGKESGLAAFAVIPLTCEEPFQKQDPADVVAVPIRRKAKMSLCLCISTVVVIVLILGVGMALFMGHHGDRYSFRCGVTYEDYPDYDRSDAYMAGQNSVNEDIEVDTAKHYERIEIPEQHEVEKLTILHDFTVNMTAYRLWRSEVCYITWLDMDIVMGPSEFIRRAEENPDFLSEHYESVYETYRAVLPELDSLAYGFGDYIPLLCQLVDTYWIEKIPADELADWEAFWERYDAAEADDEYEGIPELRRRRAAEAGVGIKSLGTMVTSFAGKIVEKVRIFNPQAVQMMKELGKLKA
ncbi:integral membrane protein 2C-like [Asterias rubens]|uniref:integral membrane protein 2C-like n=1 Tax=Asterias rubens TaxID=7604 RepID=UPI00145565E0|nr:integral membrane protein 2C-like [Asterias rubens]